MNAHQPELREAALNLVADEIRVRAGFRVTTSEPLAGGPVEMEFFVESTGPCPLQLAVNGDLMRQRPGQICFTATFEGLPLADPMRLTPYMGGPAGIVQVSTVSPWHQPLILNQFLDLEHTPERLMLGAAGRLNLECRRPLPLVGTVAAALSKDVSTILVVNLAFDLRRDDAALAALAASLFDEVMQGPPALRERPLALLLSLRGVARNQIEALTRHADLSVVSRARHTLSISV